MFAIEKDIELTYEEVNLIAGENRGDSYLKINPFGVVPSLELPNGEYLNESVAICEYLEEQADFPKLIGDSANKRATRSWQRRIELLVSENIYNAYRFSVGLEIYKDRVHCIPDAAEDLEKAAQKNLMIIDQLIENRTWICGDWFSLSDILLFCALDFRCFGRPTYRYRPSEPQCVVCYHDDQRKRPLKSRLTLAHCLIKSISKGKSNPFINAMNYLQCV